MLWDVTGFLLPSGKTHTHNPIPKTVKSKENDKVFSFNKLDFLIAKCGPEGFTTALAQAYRKFHPLSCFIRQRLGSQE
jgi:hypothetical protein